MKDAQRGKLYRWERQALWPGRVHFSDKPELTLAQLQQIVEKAWRAYGMAAPAPRVEAGRNSRYDHATGSRHRIKLPPWAQNVTVLLHELTHAMLRWHNGDYSHGPGFARLHIELRVWVLKDDRRALLQSARRSRLKIGALQDAPKRRGGLRAPRIPQSVSKSLHSDRQG